MKLSSLFPSRIASRGAIAALLSLSVVFLSHAQAPAPQTPAPGAQPPAGGRGQGRGGATQGSPASQKPPQTVTPQTYPPDLVQRGQGLFASNCGFCHGRDAMGGETGPDLTRSALVAEDVRGDKITPVVRTGRIDKGMPPGPRRGVARAARQPEGGRRGGDLGRGDQGVRGAGGRERVEARSGSSRDVPGPD